MTGKEDKTLALRQIAQQFESLFIDMMLKKYAFCERSVRQRKPVK